MSIDYLFTQWSGILFQSYLSLVLCLSPGWGGGESKREIEFLTPLEDNSILLHRKKLEGELSLCLPFLSSRFFSSTPILTEEESLQN